MSILLDPDTPETRKALNDLARHQTIKKLLQDILFDLNVCEIEGWDKNEYIDLIIDSISQLKRKGNT